MKPSSLVRPIMRREEERGLSNIVRILRECDPESIPYSSNPEQDVIEHENALRWIERYVDFNKSFIRIDRGTAAG